MTGYVQIGLFGDKQSTNLCPVSQTHRLFLSEDQGGVSRKGAMNQKKARPKPGLLKVNATLI